MGKPYRGKNPFLKALYEDPHTMKRYNFSWYVNNPKDVSKPLFTGSQNFRCVDKDKWEITVPKILESIKKKYKLPSISVIIFAVRRVQR